VQGDSHVVVEQVESRHEIRRILPLGQPVPLLTGATARAMLASLPEDQVADVLARTRAAAISARLSEARDPGDGAASTAARDLGPTAADLAAIQRRGYSLSAGERLQGGTAISAPVFDREGQLVAALSVSGPRFRFTLARANRCGLPLKAAAADLSHALGHRMAS
jgi:IclR family transcriptional regulator, acetate operon repressor